MSRTQRSWPSRARLLAGVAPLALALVACAQMVTALVYDLSPWKGGGFGMFSTVDSPAARFVRLELVTPSGRASPLQLPEGTEAYALAARSLPTRARAVQLSRATARALARESPCPGLVRAEIWRYRLESEDDPLLVPERVTTGVAALRATNANTPAPERCP